MLSKMLKVFEIVESGMEQLLKMCIVLGGWKVEGERSREFHGWKIAIKNQEKIS